MSRVREWLRRMLRAIVSAASRYGPDGCSQSAAAISYHVLLAIFPFVLLVASILGLVLRDAGLRKQLAEAIVERLPVIESAGVNVDRALNAGTAPLGLLGLIGLATLVWSASGMMGALRVAFNRAWRVERSEPYLRAKLRDVAVVFALEVLVIGAVGLTVAREILSGIARDGSSFDRFLARQASGVLVTGILAPLLLVFVVLLVGYRLVPAVRPAWGDALAGALVASGAARVVFEGFALYTARFADYSVVYGSLATLVAFLLLVYLTASAVLFGAEVAASWPQAAEAPLPGPSVPFRSKVASALRGLVSRGPDGA